MIGFMIEGLSRATNKEHHDSVQLDSLLGSWNLQRMRVLRDGNCFFTSVATSLLKSVQEGDLAVLEALRQIGVRDQQLDDLASLQRLLRVRMVEQWTKNFIKGF